MRNQSNFRTNIALDGQVAEKTATNPRDLVRAQMQPRNLLLWLPLLFCKNNIQYTFLY